MAEYIEREAVLNLADDFELTLEDDEIFFEFISPHKVKELPAADVAPIRRGRWIWDDEGYHCSECFYHAYGETGEVLSGNWHFCPNCGAEMEVNNG